MEVKYIPKRIVDMMQARGYDGPDTLDYFTACEWLRAKYGAFIQIIPRYMTPLTEDGDEQLMWELYSRDTKSKMDCDGYCEYFAIHQEDNPSYKSLEEADEYGEFVFDDSEKFYYSPEEAYNAGLIRTMLWLDSDLA